MGRPSLRAWAPAAPILVAGGLAIVAWRQERRIEVELSALDAASLAVSARWFLGWVGVPGTTVIAGSTALSERPGRGDSIAGWVLAQGTSLLIADIEQSKFAPMARNRSNMGTSFICTPIAVKNHVIGVMNLSSRPDHPSFNESHLVLADIVATLIGKSVQVERLQTLIRSRVAQLSLAREGKEVSARLTDGTLAPARVAKLLAKSFFKDMAAAGFEPGQIIEAASEIITLVSTDIARLKKRMTRTTK